MSRYKTVIEKPMILLNIDIGLMPFIVDIDSDIIDVL